LQGYHYALHYEEKPQDAEREEQLMAKIKDWE